MLTIWFTNINKKNECYFPNKFIRILSDVIWNSQLFYTLRLRLWLSTGRVCVQPKTNLTTLGDRKVNPAPTIRNYGLSQFRLKLMEQQRQSNFFENWPDLDESRLELVGSRRILTNFVEISPDLNRSRRICVWERWGERWTTSFGREVGQSSQLE